MTWGIKEVELGRLERDKNVSNESVWVGWYVKMLLTDRCRKFIGGFCTKVNNKPQRGREECYEWLCYNK